MSQSPNSSLVLLSGGLDSSASLAFLVDQGVNTHALFIDYGQKAAARERLASQRVAEVYRTPWMEIKIDWLGKLGKSALTEPLRVLPLFDPSDLDSIRTVQESAVAVWVPNRNGVFAMVAAAVAEARSIEAITLGLNAEEAVTFSDNSEEFLKRTEKLLEFSTRSKVRLICPTVRETKREIVNRLRSLKSGVFPWDWVWACYQGGDIACGRCESCVRFKRAIQ